MMIKNTFIKTFTTSSLTVLWLDDVAISFA